MKRILFLDIDGVANCERFRRAAFTEAIALVKWLADERLIDPERVARLNAIVEATGAEVVISAELLFGSDREKTSHIVAVEGGWIAPTRDGLWTDSGWERGRS